MSVDGWHFCAGTGRWFSSAYFNPWLHFVGGLIQSGFLQIIIKHSLFFTRGIMSKLRWWGNDWCVLFPDTIAIWPFYNLTAITYNWFGKHLTIRQEDKSSHHSSICFRSLLTVTRMLLTPKKPVGSWRWPWVRPLWLRLSICRQPITLLTIAHHCSKSFLEYRLKG